MDLRHSDTEESIAAQVRIRLVDAGNGGKADPGQIQDLAEPRLRWTASIATRDQLSKAVVSCVGTRRGAGAAMAQAEIPEDQTSTPRGASTAAPTAGTNCRSRWCRRGS